MGALKLLRDHSQLPTDEWRKVVTYYRTHTARETAAQFGLQYKQALVTALARAHDKKAAHGGARKGSGNASERRAAVYRVKNAILAAKSVQGLHSLPDPEQITPENYQEQKTQVANTIRATIAELKKVLDFLA